MPHDKLTVSRDVLLEVVKAATFQDYKGESFCHRCDAHISEHHSDCEVFVASQACKAEGHSEFTGRSVDTGDDYLNAMLK